MSNNKEFEEYRLQSKDVNNTWITREIKEERTMRERENKRRGVIEYQANVHLTNQYSSQFP